MSDFDPAAAAQMLAEAWSTGMQIPSLPEEVRPRTLAQGYDVQDLVAEMLGENVVGWKLGLSSTSAMRRANLSRPLVGRVYAARCMVSGERIALPVESTITVEAEVAFELARALRSFLDHAKERELELKAGTVLSTGSISEPFACRGASEILARAADLELSIPVQSSVAAYPNTVAR